MAGEVEVYADLLFMVNFSMDFLCFYITAVIMHRKLPKIRTFISCTAGGIYSVVSLFPDLLWIFSFASDIGACILMCAIVFYRKKSRAVSVLLMSVVYFAVSALLGGIMTAAYNLLNQLDLPIDAISSDGIDAWVIALLAVGGSLVTVLFAKFFRKSTSQRLCRVSVTVGSQTVSIDSVCDSGNLLRDPISGKCVIVADIEKIKILLPYEIYISLSSSNCRDCPVLSSDDEFSKRVRLIPTRTANGTGMLYAFLPDRTVISDQKDQDKGHEAEVLIALSVIPEGALVPSELLL